MANTISEKNAENDKKIVTSRIDTFFDQNIIEPYPLVSFNDKNQDSNICFSINLFIFIESGLKIFQNNSNMTKNASRDTSMSIKNSTNIFLIPKFIIETTTEFEEEKKYGSNDQSANELAVPEKSTRSDGFGEFATLFESGNELANQKNHSNMETSKHCFFD